MVRLVSLKTAGNIEEVTIEYYVMVHSYICPRTDITYAYSIIMSTLLDLSASNSEGAELFPETLDSIQ